MPNAFNFQASPFDCLAGDEQQVVRAGVDIAYFREGDAILDEGIPPTHLFVVIKGFVRQYELGGAEPVAGFGPNDTFDGRSLLTGQVAGRFVAAEEVLAYQLSRELVNGLIARNATFGARLFSDLSNKLAAIAGQRGRHELQSLEMARVDAIAIRAPHFVDADCDVLSVVRLFQSERATNVLVRDARADPPRLGIFTVTALQRAVLHGAPLDRLPVGEVASFGLVSVRAGDPVGDALTVMVRHKVHRVVVMADDAGEQVIGVLEAMDLFSFLANHSYLINREIAEARDLPALGQACDHITRLIGLLHRGGTRVGQIATLVQALNAKLFERTWQLIAPPELVANSCLIVMGSEGRGEQLLKTDQDNGLLLRDGYAPPEDFDAICARMTQALVDFGYPPCPGGVMLSNPLWRGSGREFAQRAQDWLLQPDGDNLMSLAIFLDAHAVCGDASLLAGVRERLFTIATDNEPMLARFASVVDAFAADTGWWHRILDFGDDAERSLDIKKQGLFPLVHGVRSLALAAHLAETSTAARLQALAARGQIERTLADDVLQSLHFFMNLRLAAGLEEREAGKTVSGRVDPAKLNSLDRDLLKDTLQVVKRFRRMLRLRFHLDAV
ncbi:DUF294 nucleotidyltransferase-like domain-containing protein [Variovorax sp. YR216]|uniref:DUF294 nucleotidyltransferase-like domain-containing protein n=1 Tax=Variovorax sp. YR216 TaxID=1882828 RepID=UPI000897F25E|nr:DUF294 nucleotidyltransferase-like domain-containing protein [Variovorax sp. YR216]SEB19929.1 CBS domain-containing protein [Variovorax sp. YR216]